MSWTARRFDAERIQEAPKPHRPSWGIMTAAGGILNVGGASPGDRRGNALSLRGDMVMTE